MKKLMYGVLLSTVLVTGQVYASQTINFSAHEKKDFYCEITGATPDELAGFFTRNVDVQGFPCAPRERGKLLIKATEINKYYFKGQATDKAGQVFLAPYGTFGVKCSSGQGNNRTEYRPGERYCPPSTK